MDIPEAVSVRTRGAAAAAVCAGSLCGLWNEAEAAERVPEKNKKTPPKKNAEETERSRAPVSV